MRVLSLSIRFTATVVLKRLTYAATPSVDEILKGSLWMSESRGYCGSKYVTNGIAVFDGGNVCAERALTRWVAAPTMVDSLTVKSEEPGRFPSLELRFPSLEPRFPSLEPRFVPKWPFWAPFLNQKCPNCFKH